jgi:pimeloyl-ACP methyl ester carboxylesterase
LTCSFAGTPTAQHPRVQQEESRISAGRAHSSARQTRRQNTEIPDTEWLIVNHAGHAVHSEHPEIVGPRIVDFLLRHP